MQEKYKSMSNVPNRGNFPNLRFTEFDGEWENKRLGEVEIDIIDGDRGTNYPNGKDFSNDGYCLFLNAKNVTKNGFSFVETIFITKKKDELLRKGKLERFDIVLTTRGSVGHISYYDISVPYNHLRINSGMVLIRTKQTKISSDYLYKYFNSNQIQKEIDKVAFGSAQPQLTVGEISKFIISFPVLLEQQKIATFLSLIDERIQTQNKIILELESLIKETSKKLFSQQLRFKNDDGSNFPDWKVKKLGEIGKTYNGLTGKKKENFGSGKQYIQYKQIFDQSKIDITKCGLVFVKDDENQNRVRKGDVFFTVSSETPSEIGMSSVLLDGIEEMYLNSFCFGFRPNSNEIFNISFSRFLFRSEIFRDEIIKLAQGSTRFNMSKVELMKLKISLPTIEEQIKIANFLSSINEKIDVENLLLNKLQTQKKYLLSNLFI